jgi:hypothetical protein
LHSAKLSFEAIISYLNNKISLEEMEKKYATDYQKTFSKRVNIARKINAMFGNPVLTNWNFRFLKIFPGLVDVMSKQIHGKVF